MVGTVRVVPTLPVAVDRELGYRRIDAYLRSFYVREEFLAQPLTTTTKNLVLIYRHHMTTLCHSKRHDHAQRTWFPTLNETRPVLLGGIAGKRTRAGLTEEKKDPSRVKAPSANLYR